MQVILNIDDREVPTRVRLPDVAPGIWRVRLRLNGEIGPLQPGAIIARSNRAAELITFEKDALPSRFTIIVGLIQTAHIYDRYANANILNIAAEAPIFSPN